MEELNLFTNAGTEQRDAMRMRRWEEEKAAVAEMGDVLGRGIDEGIKEGVIAFNVSGLHTSASCEGHIGSGVLFPWVEVSAPDKPDERFVGEGDAAVRIAARYGITEEDVRRANNEGAWREWIKEVTEREETSEFSAWRKKNEALKERAGKFLEKFYETHTPLDGMKLGAQGFGDGGFRVCVESEYSFYPIPDKEISDEKEREYLAQQDAARREMRLFAQFLKERYFAGE